MFVEKNLSLIPSFFLVRDGRLLWSGLVEDLARVLRETAGPDQD